MMLVIMFIDISGISSACGCTLEYDASLEQTASFKGLQAGAAHTPHGSSVYVLANAISGANRDCGASESKGPEAKLG